MPVAQSCLTLWLPMDCTLLGSPVYESTPGRNTRVGCHSLLQGIFQTQGSNSGVLHCRQILYSVSRSVMSDSLQPHGLQHASILCPWDFPSKITGVGCHFLLQGIFPTRDQNCIFCIGGQILYHCDGWKVLNSEGKTRLVGSPQQPLITWDSVNHIPLPWGLCSRGAAPCAPALPGVTLI